MSAFVTSQFLWITLFVKSRDIRRHNLSRMKAKARRIGQEHQTKDVERAWVRFAENLAMCSCWMCGHQRYHHGPRPQEHKALAKWRDDLNEWLASA